MSAEEIKDLNEVVLGVGEKIPVVGEAIKKMSPYIKMGYDGFVDNVLAPVFFPQEKRIMEENARKQREREERVARREEAKIAGLIREAETYANFDDLARSKGFNNASEYSSDIFRRRRENALRRRGMI
jgi:hypothetical protein